MRSCLDDFIESGDNQDLIELVKSLENKGVIFEDDKPKKYKEMSLNNE